MQGNRRRLELRRNAAKRPGPRHRILLPAELAYHQLADLEPRVSALDHFADALGRHHVADLQRRRVRPSLAHAAALVWVN
jgi:hypothetical protein